MKTTSRELKRSQHFPFHPRYPRSRMSHFKIKFYSKQSYKSIRTAGPTTQNPTPAHLLIGQKPKLSPSKIRKIHA